MKIKRIKKIGYTTLKIIVLTFSCIFFIILFLALTPAPFYMHHSLGNDPNKTTELFIPEYVIMLGGGGMPSQDNLIRLYYTAQYATHYQIPVIIMHPEDSANQDKMLQELTSKGVPANNITFSTQGTNTRSQILSFKENFPEFLHKRLFIITSPEHLSRSIKCFNKLGFTQVHGTGAFEATVDFNLSLKDQKLEGNTYIPEVNSTNIRYTFWNYLQLEIICFREYIALTYYKLKGWI